MDKAIIKEELRELIYEQISYFERNTSKCTIHDIDMMIVKFSAIPFWKLVGEESTDHDIMRISNTVIDSLHMANNFMSGNNQYLCKVEDYAGNYLYDAYLVLDSWMVQNNLK